MTISDKLLDQFKACLAYKNSAPWKKPLLDPVRFVRNQTRHRGYFNGPVGGMRKINAFHQRDFVVVNGEGVSEQIASYGVYEENLTAAFLRLIKPGQTVVDIGMHLGYYTTLFAELVGEAGAVHSFEPTPSTRELAQLNVGKFPQVTVHGKAVWSNHETLTFRDYGWRWMAFNSFTEARMEDLDVVPRLFDVDAISLDSFSETISSRIFLVKVDAESAEKQILLGADRLLRQDRPLISLEVGDFQDKPTSLDLIVHLQKMGYAPWEFSNEGFKQHEQKKVYSYNNLIFAPLSQDLSIL